MRSLALFLLLTLSASGQKILLVVQNDVRPEVLAGLEQGASKAVALAWKGATIQVLDQKGFLKEEALSVAAGCLLFQIPGKAASVARSAVAARVPVVDLGQAGLAGATAASLHANTAGQASDSAWWLAGPFAHHKVGVLHGRNKTDRTLATAFARAFAAIDPGKIALKPASVSGSVKALAKKMEKQRMRGTTAWYCAGNLTEGRRVVAASLLIKPRPVVMLASTALAPSARAPKDEPAGYLPEGTIVMDRDLPGPESVKQFEGAGPILAMSESGGPWALAAFDGVVALKRAIDASRSAAGVSPASLLYQGTVVGPRGRYGSARRQNLLALDHIPLIVEGSRFRPFPELHLDNPQKRPVRAPFTVRSGLGGLGLWNTHRLRPRPGTVACFFNWGGPKLRTIEAELANLNLNTGGRQPVLDHLVREKVLFRTMSITGEKFGLGPDGSVGKNSLGISMTARVDRRKDKVRMVWPTIIAGDDPAAGGRAFGSYCIIYSTFIYRTIFKKYDLLQEPVELGDLSRLTGLGRPPGRYVLGSREDILYRLIDKFSGSMALTGAHEIGHLCGLGHDVEDPRSIMNVREGGGLPYKEGLFTPKHWKALTKRLGISRPD